MRFRFRPALTLCVALALAILIALGQWQLQRRTWKLDLIAAVEARAAATPIPIKAALAGGGEDLNYTRVTAAGVYDYPDTHFVFGAHRGEAGVFVFTRFKSEIGEFYVNRGFAPQAEAKENCFCEPKNEGAATVRGLLRTPEKLRPPAAWFVPRERAADGLWLIRDPALFAAAADRPAADFYVDAAAPAAAARDEAAWPRGGLTRLDFNNRHLEYALTWFGLAGALIAVWLAFSFRRA